MWPSVGFTIDCVQIINHHLSLDMIIPLKTNEQIALLELRERRIGRRHSAIFSAPRRKMQSTDSTDINIKMYSSLKTQVCD